MLGVMLLSMMEWCRLYLISLIVICLTPTADNWNLLLWSKIYNSKTHFFHVKSARSGNHKIALLQLTYRKSGAYNHLLSCIRQGGVDTGSWQVRLLSQILAKLVSTEPATTEQRAEVSGHPPPVLSTLGLEWWLFNSDSQSSDHHLWSTLSIS